MTALTPQQKEFLRAGVERIQIEHPGSQEAYRSAGHPLARYRWDVVELSGALPVLYGQGASPEAVAAALEELIPPPTRPTRPPPVGTSRWRLATRQSPTPKG